jgi:hypothetical protein
MDETKAGGDWISGGKDAAGWSESRSYLRWENPVLGINAEGKVSPFIPGCQVIFTQLNQDGDTELLNYIYTTVDGTSGIAQNPIQPHTISTVARKCESCHTESKALGLGTGTYNSLTNGLNIDFELERIVDEDGNQIQATSHEGARAFNKEEQEKIYRAGLCIGCHSSYDDPIWSEITDFVGLAPNTENHKEIMKKALMSLVPEPEPEPPEEPDERLIPGFPVEAIIIGTLIGYLVLNILRKRN